MSTTAPSPSPSLRRAGLDPRELSDALAEAARGLRYGSIEVVVHDAQIVQIVRTDKRRIEK